MTTIRLRKLTLRDGVLVRVYGTVYSSNGMAQGSIEFHGAETSNLLALLQMSREIRVIDCSQKERKECLDEDAWRDAPEERIATHGTDST